MSRVIARAEDNRAAPGRRDRSGLCARVIEREGSPERLGLRPSDTRAGGRLTLEQRLDSVWEGLRAGGVVACPVCQAEMAALGGAQAVRCASCGATLS